MSYISGRYDDGIEELTPEEFARRQDEVIARLRSADPLLRRLALQEPVEASEPGGTLPPGPLRDRRVLTRGGAF